MKSLSNSVDIICAYTHNNILLNPREYFKSGALIVSVSHGVIIANILTESSRTMVLTLDGNSEHVAHA